MNAYFVAAAVLTFAVGAVHSVLGEVLIFRRLRAGGFVPIEGGTLLRRRHLGILWASWHVLTVFGWALALLMLRWPAVTTGTATEGARVVAVAMAVGAALVGIGTRGRHPGWVGLLLVALLVWMGSR